MILAGGQGERLYPLTRDRAKPAVPFAGSYRLIDFSLSNCLNSGLRRIYLLTQYKSGSLNRHIRLGWNMFNPELGEYIETTPPQQRLTSHWYLGTADAIYQNIYTLQRERPRHVLVLSGDHVYKMDYSRVLQQHVETDADLTIACIEMPLHEASRLGVVSLEADVRAADFQEKPDSPQPMPGCADKALCSMGVYVFRTELLVRRVIEDSKQLTAHDFGCDVIPAMIRAGDRAFVFRFIGADRKRPPYWRDIGTLDAYWEANMDMVRPAPPFDLYDPQWPVHTYAQSAPPAKTIAPGGRAGEPAAELADSLICSGAVITGACVRNSVIGPNVRIERGSRVEDSVIMDGVCVGCGVTIRRAVIDKLNRIPDGTAIGVDAEADRKRFTLSDGGVAVVPKQMPLFRR